MHRLQQDGRKCQGVGKFNIRVNSCVAKTMTALDEFRYGFPSDGLSTVTNKWWGCKSPTKDSTGDGEESAKDGKCQFDTPKDDNFLESNKKEEDGDVDNKVASQKPDSLVAIRKRIAKEGREAVKLVVYRRFGSKKLSRRDQALLMQLFKSSLSEDSVTDFS